MVKLCLGLLLFLLASCAPGANELQGSNSNSASQNKNQAILAHELVLKKDTANNRMHLSITRKGEDSEACTTCIANIAVDESCCGKLKLFFDQHKATDLQLYSDPEGCRSQEELETDLEEAKQLYSEQHYEETPDGTLIFEKSKQRLKISAE